MPVDAISRGAYALAGSNTEAGTEDGRQSRALAGSGLAITP
jgi:hypothetical protein